MHCSPTFKSSPHRGASPDGRCVASLTSSSIHVRSTETLQTLNTRKLPTELSGPVLTLLWSPSSTKILVSTTDQIHVLSALDSSFHAVVRNPVSSSSRPAHIQFGNDDNEILVFSSFGLKLLIFDLSTSKAVEISNPKFHHPSMAARSLSIRPTTDHLALLSRVSGRDMVSLHSPVSRQLQRSWYPETIDAQAICWSPNGQWLLMWESPAHGWRLLLYTADGQLVRTVDGSQVKVGDDAALEPGIRQCQFSPNRELLAVGDYSRKIAILSTNTWREDLALTHPSTISPSETLQVWQEQLHGSLADRSPRRSFLRATQEISPPGPQTDSKTLPDKKSGCSLVFFDASSNLLASKLDDSPSTLWIWDVAAAELRAVLIFHSPVGFHWHPRIRELLLICAVDDTQQSVPFVWDPLSNGPKILAIQDHLPSEKGTGKFSASWINWEKETAALLLSDARHYCLSSLPDAEVMPQEWADHRASTLRGSPAAGHPMIRDDVPLHAEDDSSMIDDTFSFKHG